MRLWQSRLQHRRQLLLGGGREMNMLSNILSRYNITYEYDDTFLDPRKGVKITPFGEYVCN